MWAGIAVLTETLCANLCGARCCRALGDAFVPGTQIPAPGGVCSMLDDRNRCSIYETRPQACRDFPEHFQLVDGCALSALARPYTGRVMR